VIFGATVAVSASECQSRTPPLDAFTLHTTDMELKGKVAVFPFGKTTFDIIDVATGQVVQQHDAEGILIGYASVQKNIAALTVSEPRRSVHVMDIMSGKLLCQFVLSNGRDARVALGRDLVTLVVGSNSGL
jgi:hypothetical protein